MRRNVSRPILWAALTGAALVLVAGGYVLCDPLVERWMIHRLGSADAEERAAAVEWLGRRGTARAVPALIDDLERMLAEEVGAASKKSPSKRIPSTAILPLPGQILRSAFEPPLLPSATAILAVMARAPGDCARTLAQHATTRQSTSVQALFQLGARAEAAVPELVRKLEGADASAWDWVPFLLARIGPPARAGLPHLLGRLEKARPDTVPLARCVGNIATAVDVPALLALLESPQLPVRRAALWALERMGPNAARAATALEACLRDPDEEVRVLATQALGSIREEPGSSAHQGSK